MKRTYLHLGAAALTAGAVLAGAAFAQPAGERAKPASSSGADAPATTQPAETSPASSTAEDLMKRMSDQVQQNPLIEPTQRPEGRPAGGAATPRGASQRLDPNIIGIAPGGKMPELRREGEFVINRRGRIVRAPGGAQVLFVFEADSQHAPEPPMILLPSQYLQSMEEIVQERGDKIVFVLSGQILLYRGANYLLPTMMRLDHDRGNLQK